ncbi:MAG TPA: glycosyltransferase family 2 protein [Thermoanaerobaculia bacterium]|nr:glycosyltransferase family 2 protein [Thermoanaerobaculia bacterium]
MTPPRATIIVVHHRGKERLLRTLDEVCRQASAERAEVVVVDNASREGADREIARRFPAVRALRQEENTGFARACSTGAEASASELLIFFNDDAVPEPGWLAAFLEAASSLPADVRTIAGRLTDSSGKRTDFIDGFLVFDGHAFSDRAGGPLPDDLGGAPGDERLFACGGNMMVRRDEFLSSGGFDPWYFAYLEDVDFGWRQWILGRRVVYEPRAAARHEGGATGEALGVFHRGYLIEKNAWATAYKNFDDEHLRALWPAAATAFLSRLDSMVRRDGGSAALDEDPYRVSRRRRWSERMARAFGVSTRSAALRIGDPLAIAQLRALRALFSGADELGRRRAAVQSGRVRSDREIFAKFPLRIVPTYPGDEIFASPFFAPFLAGAPDLVPATLDEILPGRR